MRTPTRWNWVPDALRFFNTLLLACLARHNDCIVDARPAH
ncbi:hypothetical protein ABIC51_005295 [Burkholderia sp. 572]